MSTAGQTRIIDRMTVRPAHRSSLLADVRALAAAPAPALDVVERTLTDGYACALELEAEHLRLRRRLQDEAAALGGSTAGAASVSALARGIAEKESDLAELRDALEVLRLTANRLRRG